MKILITGGSGLLGSATAAFFKNYYSTFITYTNNKVSIGGCEAYRLDITNKEEVFKVIWAIRPDFIIHTAALTGVGICENNKELAYNINVNGTRHIAEAADKINSRIVHISTDYVFDGKKGMYKETDKPNPLNYYAKTKLEAEKLINKNHAIIRTSIYGWNIIKERKNFATFILEGLENNKKIDIFEDQYNAIILANNLAEALKEIVDKNKKGIYNIGGSERQSKYEFALKLADVFELNKGLINPISINDAEDKAQRPPDVSLDSTKAKKELNVKLLNIEEGLELMKKLRDENYLGQFRTS